MRHRSTSVAIDLSALEAEEKIEAAALFLDGVHRLRGETGAPHWVIVAAADEIFPRRGGGRAAKIFRTEWTGVCLVTTAPAAVAPEVLAVARHAFATSADALRAVLTPHRGDTFTLPELAPGEALAVRLDDPRELRCFRFFTDEL
jgi:hypothetical protein